MPDDTAITLSEILNCEPWEVVEVVSQVSPGVVAEYHQKIANLQAEIDDLREEVKAARDPKVLRRERIAAATALAPRPGRFRSAILQAMRRRKEWGIDEESYLALIERPCYVCGSDVGGGVGLDRQDSRRGYFLDNVEPCCGRCNIARGRTGNAAVWRMEHAARLAAERAG